MNSPADMRRQSPISRARAWLARHSLLNFVLALVLLPALASCEDSSQKPVLLGILGYNYTDRYIDSFTVGGAGGSDTVVSTDTAGGGKLTCCIGYNPRRSLPIQMTVTWVWGSVEDANRKLIKEQEHAEAIAELRGPVPANPRYLEVHFMPDRTVQLRITADISPPMLIIDRSKTATP